jgi:hypothetical protein
MFCDQTDTDKSMTKYVEKLHYEAKPKIRLSGSISDPALRTILIQIQISGELGYGCWYRVPKLFHM